MLRADATVGDVLGGYRLEEIVGQGPTGVVFRASDPRLERDVALKIVHAEVIADPAYRERLERELQVAVRLDHAALIPVFGFGEDDGLRHVVTQFVRGLDLGRLLSKVGQVDSEQALALLTQVASALDAAHAAGLVHGSVKPSNVMVAEATSSQRAGSVYVTDLAVARGVAGRPEGGEQGVRAPALEYASPEQIEGKPPTGATDQYALACVAYACLVGRPPFSRERDSAVLMAHLLEAPPSARSLADDLPENTDPVFERALAKAPSERYSSCGELVEALGAALRPQPAGATAGLASAVAQSDNLVPGSMETEFRLGSAPADVTPRPGETELTPSRWDRGEPAPQSPFPPPASERAPAVSPPSQAPAAVPSSVTPVEPDSPPSEDRSKTPATEPRPPGGAVERAEPPSAGDARARARRRRASALVAVGLVAALAVVGAVLATRGGDDAEAAVGPSPKPDRVELAGKQRYVLPLRSLLRNDDGSGGLQVAGIGGAPARVHGKVRLDRRSSTIVYVPDGGYSGPVRFTYTVKDADGDFGVATVQVQVKGLTERERALVALVPKAGRASCEAVRGSASRGVSTVRCAVGPGTLVLRAFASGGAAASAFGKQFRAGAGSCASSAATGRWIWPGASASRGRYGCAVRSKRAVFGWTYPSSKGNVLAVLTGKGGSGVRQLSAWFFARERLPRP